MSAAAIDFKLLFESAPDLYLVLDPSFHIIAVSNEYLKATLVNRKDILGRGIFDVFPDNPNDPSATGVNNLRASLERVLEKKEPDTMAVQKYGIRVSEAINSEFESRYWSPVNSPVLDEDNNVKYIIHRIKDVTEFIQLKQAGNEQSKLTEELRSRTDQMEIEIFRRAQDLQTANKKLRIVNEQLAQKTDEKEYLYKKLENLLQLKTQFFANVSHELRTPLALILMPVQKILKNNYLTPEIYRDLRIVEKNAHLLLKQVNDLLDVAKQEAGGMAVNYEEIDVAKLLRLTVENFDSLAKERSIDYTLETPKTLIAQVDSEKIQRIFINLLSNAFKFVPNKGKITCKLYAQDGRAVMTVADNGPGVPPSSREHIFERFYQVEGSASRQFAGTGLGLAIVKDFVDIHKGFVQVDEAMGGGAFFSVSVPLLAPKDAVVKKSSSPYLSQSKPMQDMQKATLLELKHTARQKYLPSYTANQAMVLVVEDNAEMNDFIVSILASDFKVITANNGVEGLQKSLEFMPDLIVSDVMMPGMSGDHMVHEIRRQAKLNDTPIILVTAKSDDDLRLKLLREGAQDYVKKPFLHDELKVRISNLINLKKAKDEIKHKIDELTTANEELDAFSRTVSHDLRSPVNSIIGFSSILLKNSILGANEKDYLGEIYTSARKMEELINDLLMLSQATRRELNHHPINLSNVVKDIVSTLHKQHPHRQVDFSIQDDISVVGDAHLIPIAIENLIHNAWKYTSKIAHAIIEFGTTTDSNTFFIKDNGVGFPQTKSDKLFAPFSRLHTETEFPGTGIGLTTVKRIIERHGGRVWAESEPSKGATFYVAMSSV